MDRECIVAAENTAAVLLRKWKQVTDESRQISMKYYTAVIEKCPDTGLYVGYVPGFVGAHSQGETIDELIENLQ